MDFLDWLSRSLLGSSQDELHEKAVVDEAERLQHELLLAVEGMEDEEWFPVRFFMLGVADQQGEYQFTFAELNRLPMWETVGWFRAQVRENLTALAEGVMETRAG